MAFHIKTEHVGVYIRYDKRRKCDDGTLDVCYYISYRKIDGHGAFEKLGWKSDGFTLERAIEKRKERVDSFRNARDACNGATLQKGRIKTKHIGVYFRYAQRRRDAAGNPDKCFDIVYQRNGRTVCERTGWVSEGYTLEDAIDLRCHRIREQRHPELFTSKINSSKFSSRKNKNITVEDAWLVYENKWLPNVKHAHNLRYMYNKHIHPHFAHREVSSLSRVDIEEYKQYLLHKKNDTNGKQLSAGSVKIILSLFRGIINKIFQWEMYEGKNPISHITIPHADVKREKYLTPDEAQKILSLLYKKDISMYYIAKISLYTGMRLSEILNLRGHYIDFISDTIFIDGKTGVRSAYIPEDIRDDLHAIIPTKVSDYIFVAKNGSPLRVQKVSSRFSSLLKENGWNKDVTDSRHKIVFHTLRHTFCSWLAIRGVPLYTISQLVGHKTIQMTQRYAKLSQDSKREALHHIGELFLQAQKNDSTITQ